MTTDTMPIAQSAREVDDRRRPRDRSTVVVNAPAAGGLWFGGWLFTIGFAQLGFWKAVLGLIIWPYFLGALAH